MFTSSRATRAPGFPMPANDPESLELATRAAAVEQPIPGHEASGRYLLQVIPFSLHICIAAAMQKIKQATRENRALFRLREAVMQKI